MLGEAGKQELLKQKFRKFLNIEIFKKMLLLFRYKYDHRDCNYKVFQ